MSTLTEQDRRRIAARYPQAGRRRPARLAVPVVLGLVLVSWMVWAGLKQADPPVVADVHGFQVVNSNLATAQLRVQRRDPSATVVCTVQATAENFVIAGNNDVTIGPGTQRITLVDVKVRTTNKATTVTVQGCHVA